MLKNSAHNLYCIHCNTNSFRYVYIDGTKILIFIKIGQWNLDIMQFTAMVVTDKVVVVAEAFLP